MSRDDWDHWTRGTAIRRAGYAGFKRNIAVAMGNWLGSVEQPPAEAVVVLRDAIEDDGRWCASTRPGRWSGARQ